jgi:hypothetical protein
MQPYFLPYIGYFQLINAVDVFVFYNDVNYINRGWVNRNYILVNGQKNLITVPLLDASQNKLINEIKVDYNGKWRTKMLQTIYYSYKRAPYFNRVYPLIENCFNDPFINISDFNITLIKCICDYLQLGEKIFLLSSDLDNKHLKSTARILDICNLEKASHYINPIGGKELYDSGDFLRFKIKLSFLKSNEIFYMQTGNKFVQNLSIIDILMFNSTHEIMGFLEKYKLE